MRTDAAPVVLVRALITLTAALLAASCGSGPAIRADGTLGGTRIESTVDSEVARYYLQSYLPGAKDNPELDARIDAITARYRGSLPSRDELRGISADFDSVDFAALFFAERLLADDCNSNLNAAFNRYLAEGRRPGPTASRYRVLFVPGWDYVDNGPLTGADFARPRMLARELGLDNELVPLPPHGSVERNAELIAAAIRGQPAGARLIVVGPSSAGPAIHLALGELLKKEERDPVKAWLNLAGILQGTPIVDWVRAPPQGWILNLVIAYKGWEEGLSSMATERSRARFDRLRIDPDILVVNYLGVPLSGSVSAFARDNFRQLRPLGPNDGLTLLPDALAPGGITIVAPGRDHFLAEDPNIDAKTVALMSLMIASLESGRRCDRKGDRFKN